MMAVRTKAVLRFCALAGAVLALAACETTDGDMTASSGPAAFGGQTQTTSFGSGGYATTTSRIDPMTGQPVVTGGSFVIGSASSGASRPFGVWTLRDTKSGSCTVSFSDKALAGSQGAYELSQLGFCSFEFSDARGWMSAGTGIALTNGSGRIIGQLLASDSNSYTGSLQTNFGPQSVTLTR
jgi:hypothetical protein